MEELKLIAIPLLVAVASVTLTAYINIKVKFSQDETSAFRDVRAILGNIALFVINAWIAYSLYREVTSPEPPSRIAIFVIVFYSLSLFWFAISYLLLQVIAIIKDIVALQKTHWKITMKTFDLENPDDK